MPEHDNAPRYPGLPPDAQAAMGDVQAYVDTLTLPEALGVAHCLLANLGLSSAAPTFLDKIRAGLGAPPATEQERRDHNGFLAAILGQLHTRVATLTDQTPDHAVCLDFITASTRAGVRVMAATRRPGGSDSTGGAS